MLILQEKQCTKCKIIKPLDMFNKSSKSKDGVEARCKKCKSDSYQANKEAILIKRKEYYEANRESVKEYKRQYQIKNKEVLSLKNKVYYDNNKESIYEYQRRYYENNKENVNTRSHQYHAENKDKLNLHSKQYREANKDNIKQYLLANRTKILQQQKEYRQNNHDSVLNLSRKWRTNNKEKAREYQREYQQTEKGKMSFKNSHHKRRSVKSIGDVTTEDLLQLRANSKTCYWCDCALKNKKVHIDHYIPLSKGGLHTLSNLVISCQRCNNIKHSKDPIAFANSIGKLL